MTRSAPALPSVEQLQALWGELNGRYFRGALSSIEIVWSSRLTSSAGMFVSRVGPRARVGDCADSSYGRRLIRLSSPLFQRLSEDAEQVEREILSTLAHEMIHQWQFDVLKRRPNHGPDFSHKMAAMNRDGLGITIWHWFNEAVRALATHAWQCRRCGKVYERQRRTIRPSRHRCGACRGQLWEVLPAEGESQKGKGKRSGQAIQMELPLAIS